MGIQEEVEHYFVMVNALTIRSNFSVFDRRCKKINFVLYRQYLGYRIFRSTFAQSLDISSIHKVK